MKKAEKLKNARNVMLKLHKSMLDNEREIYERLNGPLNSSQFLGLLLEDKDFEWLRKFSMLIVEIDEMFAAKDGIPEELIDANLEKVTELVEMKEPDEQFRERYQLAVQSVPESASLHSEIKSIMSERPA